MMAQEKNSADIQLLLERADFTKREEIVALFPIYKQLQIASRKPLPKNVNIEYFTLKTPFGDQTLLSNAELILEANRRQCLFGPNSSGKTLLFVNMVNGSIEGFPKHLHVHHCRELEHHEMNDTVLNTVVNSHPYRNILVKVEAKLRSLIARKSPVPEAKELEALKNHLEFVENQMISISGYQAEEKAGKMLRVLGFDEIGQNKLVSSLSGGLKMRVALCMAFFIEADLLLLDEPTNHLDFPSVLWLENRLRGYRGSFLLVSHDRELLKNVCNSVLLLEDKMIKYYNCGFLEFEKKKAAEDKKKYEEIEKFLKRNANTHPSTPIGRMVLDKKSWFDKYHAKSLALQSKFTFPLPVALENVANETLANPSDLSLINLQNVRFSYDVSTGHFIFNEPIAFNVKTTTRVGVMGPNGAGKSTLLKLLTHKLTPTEGSVVQHPKFKLAYFGQHSTAELNLDNTPMSFMQDHFPKVNSGQLRSHLGKTGIVGDVADTRISGLSYSQRSCVIFSKLTLACPHLLIMDEPTNFLDLESVDSLIAACNKYKGALLLVSHNRDFLKKCANQYLSVVPGHFELYDDLKTAEKATYTFIQEMEEGGHVSGKDTLTNNPGGGSVHSSQKVVSTSPTPTVEKKINSAEAPAVPAPVPAPATTTSTTATIATDTPVTPAKPKEQVVSTVTPFSVGDKIQAKYSQDGKWYSACIKALKGEMYLVHYTQYGNSELVTHDSVRNFIPSNNHTHNHNNNHNKKSHPNNNNKSRALDR